MVGPDLDLNNGFLFVCGFTSQSTAMVMLRQSVYLTTTFSRAGLDKFSTFACNRQHPFLKQQKEETDHRKYVMINLQESIGPGLDQTHDPWISNRTHYQLHYGARLTLMVFLNYFFVWKKSLDDNQMHEQSPSMQRFKYSKSCINGHSKIDKTKILMTNGSSMQVESIAECSPWSILQYFWPAWSVNWSWKPIFGHFTSGRFKQVYTISMQIIQCHWYFFPYRGLTADIYIFQIRRQQL